MYWLIYTLRELFVYIGIYTTIKFFWQMYELRKYKEIRPNGRDALIALVLALILKLLIF